MGNYKSLVVVVVLGGVMLFMAGILLKIEAGRLRGGRAEAATPGASDGRLPVVRVGAATAAADSAADLVETLDRLEALARANHGKAALVDPEMKALWTRAVDLVTPADWPLVAERMKAVKSVPGLSGLYLVLAGATRDDRAVPVIVAAYAEHPLRVVEALGKCGSRSALNALRDLYVLADRWPDRFGMLRSLRNYAAADAAEFLTWALSHERTEAGLAEAVTLARYFPTEPLVDRLCEMIRVPGTPDSVARKALNSLAAMQSVGGPDVVIALLDDTTISASRRGAVEQAIAFMKAPDLVGGVCDRIERDGEVAPYFRQFLLRNLGGASRDLLEARRDGTTNARIRETLAEILAIADERD